MSLEQPQEFVDVTMQAREVTAQARRMVVSFLRQELEVADTLISVADTTSDPETSRRNLRNAWVALATVEQFARKLNVELPERQEVHDRHLALCQRLEHVRARANVRVRSQD